MAQGGPNRRYRLAARYGAELIVVFVGVWLSLLAESWRQERIDAGTERSSLQRMRQDLELDLADLRINEARAASGVEWGSRLIDSPERFLGSESDLAHALTTLQFCSRFFNNPAEFLALRNSGQLDVIADPELRRSIVVLYGQRGIIEGSHTGDCVRGRRAVDAFMPYVETKLPPKEDLGVGRFTDEFPDGVHPRVVAVDDPVTLMNDRVFRNHVAELVAFRYGLLVQIREEIDRTTTLLSSLDDRIELLD